jgi:hypothetical protein
MPGDRCRYKQRMTRKAQHIRDHFFCVGLWALCLAGCTKEYSYEGGSIPVIPVISDSVTKILVPSCQRCDSLLATAAFYWYFEIGTSRLCGVATKGIMTTSRTGFTFFGPSACSADSGLIVEAFFEPNDFTADRQNLATNSAGFFYYDNLTNGFAMRSQQPYRINVFFKQYNHATRVGNGSFSGFAFNTKGDSALIRNGVFRVQFN